jgi:hypothetical protein
MLREVPRMVKHHPHEQTMHLPVFLVGAHCQLRLFARRQSALIAHGALHKTAALLMLHRAYVPEQIRARFARIGRITGNNRPKSPHPTMESLIKGLYFLSVGFSSGGGVPLPSMILAGRRRRRSPCEVRSTSSQFPSRRTRLQPTGPNTATRSSYADARFVNEILLWVTAVAASRLTTSITIGFGFIVGAASGAG